MRPVAARALLVAVPALMHLSASALEAQLPSSPGRCGIGNRTLGTVGGAGLGAWVGFVVSKIQISDWNDNAGSSAATRRRAQSMIIGALVGGAVGNLAFGSRPCRTVAPTLTRPRESMANRPITEEEITRAGTSGSVYDLVYVLRRNWLNARGVETFDDAARTVTTEDGREIIVPGEPQIAVYLDNIRVGSIGQLRELPVVGVREIRYVPGPQASFRWGAGHSRGAIEVITVSVTAPQS